MSRIKKISSAVLTALLFVALIVSAVFLIPKNKGNAYAAATSIGEIYNDTTKTFDQAKLEELYTALGSTNGFTGVKEKADFAKNNPSSQGNGYKNYGDKTIAGKDITVTFGGKQWYAVYLSASDTGDTVLTLWLKSSSETVKWNEYTTTNCTYPCVMYSTSEIRSFLVGSQYSTNGTDCNSTCQSTTWYNFLNTELGGQTNYSSFLVQPSHMAWQNDERGSQVFPSSSGYGSCCSINEAQQGATFDSKLSAVATKSQYNDWHNDYLFIPGICELGNNRYNPGIWNCLSNQRDNSVAFWLRSSTTTIENQIHYNESGHHYTTPNTAKVVRPALHLNLTAANGQAVKETLTAPSDIQMAYTGSPLDLGLAKTANAANWYDSALYSNIVDIDYKSQTIQNAGTYQVKLTIKSDKNYVWSDSNGISDKERTINFVVNPAKITIQNGKQSELENGYEYVYHTDGHSKHALCFPKPADGGIYNKNYINLNAVGGDDENNVKIYYHIETHAEKDHQNFVDNLLPSLKDSVKTLPDNNDAKTGWAEYTEGDSTLNVNDVQGYCVFYKVTAPNHETLYGYFSVHIITEILTIDTSSSNLNSSEIQYGSKDVPYKQADLKKLAEAIITSVKDQNNEERYKDMPEGSGLDKSKFIFYLKRTDDGSDKVINTTEDEVTGSSHWDAGKYELYVKYVDGDNSQFISFNWSGTRPVLTISPKSVTLTWKGNASWETDKAKASETVADSMDEFSWVYDGDPHCPTATYQNISDSEETLTITGDYKNADSYTATAPDVANYTFTNKTRQFKIVKAKNGWQDGKGYENRQWSIGATPTEEFIPTDIFGNKATVSYWKKYEEDSNTFSEQYFGDFTDIKEPTIIYVKVSAVSSDGNKNYDAIVVKAEIHIIECIAHQPSDVIQHDASGHWQVCKFCNTKLGDTQPHTSKSYLSDESQHWQICETCHEEFGRDSHVAKVGDNALGHDPDQHWNICATCNEEYNKVGHTFDNAGNVTKQPKCNEFGEQEFSCECGEKDPVLHQVAKTEHNYSEDWVTSEGSSQHWHECSVCHDKKEFTDHVYSEAGQITQEADCTTAGKREYKCICGAIQEREIAAKGHTAKEGWQSDGTQHWQVCATCSEIIEESRKNHSWGELVPEVQPTCTKSGHTEYYKCSECQKLKDGYKDEDIDPIPHTFGADKVRTEPTCTKQGSETGTCELCHNKVTNIIPATGHSYAEKIEREATCSLEGSKIEECTSCHEMKPDSRVSIPKTAHTYAEKIETAATCTAPGSKIEECTACHEMKPDSRTSIPMLDHSYGSWNTVLAASCSAEGKEERTCASCGGKEERALQRLAHTMQHHDEKAATETAAGNIDYYECSKCHKFFGDANGGTELSATDIVIPALGLGNGNGMDTGSGSGGDEGFFQKNWWWIVLIVAAVLLVMMLIFFISSSISRRRERERERERDRQLETLLKMQMMHYGFGGGMGGYQNSAENDMAFAEKQQPAQLPYTQEMIDVAVAAAMSAMQRMNAEKPEDQTPPPDDGGNGGGFDDDFGFYDEYKP